MTTPTHPRDRDTKPFTCRRCGGPCRAWAGSVHQWTCRTCLADYVNAQPDAPERTRTRRSGQIDEKDSAA